MLIPWVATSAGLPVARRSARGVRPAWVSRAVSFLGRQGDMAVTNLVRRMTARKAADLSVARASRTLESRQTGGIRCMGFVGSG